MNCGPAALLLFAIALGACAADPASSDAPAAGDEDDGEKAAVVDPAAGRDTSAQSCFAACQNASFSCADGEGSSREAFLAFADPGCNGEIATAGSASKTSTLRVDCGQHRVCVGDECREAFFNATSIGWGSVVCTRIIAP